MLKEGITAFKNKNSVFPRKVLVYKEGVSEG
jgi:hypothetical protein